MKCLATRMGIVCAAFVLVGSAFGQVSAASPSTPSRLKVSANGRFLVHENGSPLFWLGDTGWYLWKLNRADAEIYLSDRANKGFNVVQVHCGYDVTDSAGNRPFASDNTDTPNEPFWRNMDWVVDAAAKRGLCIALAPVWGSECPKAFAGDAQKARRLGKWLGTRYRKHAHVVWITSGEYDSINDYRLPITAAQKAVIVGLAKGLEDGHGNTQLMTIHPGVAFTSSLDFHNETWLDFNMLQSGHEVDRSAYRHPENYTSIANDYARSPAKPVLDGEPFYEDTPDGVWHYRDAKRPRGGADVVRRKAYWAVFAGALGHTYGHNDVCVFWKTGDPTDPPKASGQRAHWKESLQAPGASQMRHLRALMESRPFLSRIPDQSLLASPAGTGNDHVRATRGSDGSYAMIYVPAGQTVTVNMSKVSGGSVKASWFDPRTGCYKSIGNYPNRGTREFDAPGQTAPGNDWVLVFDGDNLSTSAAPGDERIESTGPSGYFPPPESKGGWRKLESAESIRRVAEMDPAKLDNLKQWLLESDNRTFAAVVIRRGYIVLEVERGNSAKTDARRVASVSKAVCSTVLAIASERSQQGFTPRKMKFDDSAFDFIPWAHPLSDPRKARITVKQLLNHTSGLCPEATGAPNEGTWEYVLGLSGDSRTARLAFDPGTACGYSTHALDHAALVCETVTGMPYDQFAVEALFKPLGIEHWWFEYFQGGAKIGRHPTHGLGMPARDLARIAYCMLRGGRWDNHQVVPKWFVEETAAPTHSVKGREMRFQVNAQTFSHGWELPARLTGEGGRSGQGIPADARHKPGSGGQLIAFVPSLDLIVTRQTGASGDWQFEEYLRRACQAVLP